MSELAEKIKALLGPGDIVFIASANPNGSIDLSIRISETSSEDPIVERQARLLTFALEGVMIDFNDNKAIERWVKNGSAVASQLAAIQEAEKT